MTEVARLSSQLGRAKRVARKAQDDIYHRVKFIFQRFGHNHIQ